MATKTILIVDDDQDLQDFLRLHLERAGYNVISAFNGQHALDIITNRGIPHLAVVDIYMPGMDGPSFCQNLHEFSDVPVIMLTSEVDIDVMVDIIERYAEDYMTKPFSIREFVVRVERLIRRIHSFDYSMSPSIHVDEHLQIRLGQKSVMVDGKEVSLTPIETKLLHVFLNNTNRTVTLEFLLNRLWPRQETYEDRLRVHIHRLRHKIEDKSIGRVYIVTERGLGYRFEFALSPTTVEPIRADSS